MLSQPHLSEGVSMRIPVLARVHSQLACHDHLGLVRVDRAAFLKEVDGGLIGIYEQQTLPKNIQVDKFACETRQTKCLSELRRGVENVDST